MTGSPFTILDAMAAEDLCGRAFRPPESWGAWRAFLAALFALPMSEPEAGVYRRSTARTMLPTEPAREGWVVAGRRAGKSRIAALVAVYLACFRDHAAVLAPGERGVVMVIAADRRQARVVFRYVAALLDESPLLGELVARRTKESLTLTNRVTIEVHAASFRTTRGYTIVGAVADEIAFWRAEDSANPDAEILTALRPAMATVPGALLLAISSPYARRGALWAAHRDHYGRDSDPVLVWQAETRAMNPTADPGVIAAAYAADEAAASAEYGAQFRRDVERLVAREAVEAVVVPGRRELPPVPGTDYVGFVDPSGGSADAMTLAVAHLTDGRAVLDLVRERRPPFSPEAVTAEFAAVLKSYGIGSVAGDRYAGEWPRERFREHGVAYEPAEAPKSDLYRDLLPLVNSGMVELLNAPRLVAQLVGLERRTARGGRDSIDHGPGGHDDVVNAAAGALVLAVRGAVGFVGPKMWAARRAAEVARPTERGDEAAQQRAIEERERYAVWNRSEAWCRWN